MNKHVLAAILAGMGLTLQSHAQVVVSQIWNGSNAGAPAARFVELFNKGTTPQDLTGWSVQFSGSSPTWYVLPISGVLSPGGYYLIQTAPQSPSSGTTLPRPDAIWPATNWAGVTSVSLGKIAVVNSTTPLADGCSWPSGSIVDLVGYGSANCREGASSAQNAPAMANTAPGVGLRRAGGGCTDTNVNSADWSTLAPPVPRNSLSNGFVTVTGNSSAVAPGASFVMGASRNAGASCNPLTSDFVSAVADTSGLIGGVPSLPLANQGGGFFSQSISISPAQAPGVYDIPLTVSNGVNTLTIGYRVRVFPPIANDLCANAIPLDTSVTSLTVDLSNATNDVDIGSCNTGSVGGYGVWYTITPATDVTMIFRGTSRADTSCGIWTKPAPGNAAADCTTFTGSNGSCTSSETWGAHFLAGKTYYLQLASQSGRPPLEPVVASLTWVSTPPANDSCATATEIVDLGSPIPFTVDSRAASSDPISTCSEDASDAAQSVWYRFTAVQDGALVVSLDTSSSEIPPLVMVAYEVPGTPVPGSDCPTFNSANITSCTIANGSVVSLAVTAGRGYYVMLHSDLAAPFAPTAPFSGTFSFVPRPSNDDCAGAETVSMPPYVLYPFASDNRGARPSSPPINIGSCATATADTASVWYRYDSTSTGSLVISYAPDSNQQLPRTGVWEMNPDSASCPTAGPATLCSASGSVTVPVRSGKTYYILMQTDRDSLPIVPLAGTFLLVPAPDNDDCANASILSLPDYSPVQQIVDLRGATPSAPPVSIGACDGFPVDNWSAWWRYDATGPGTLRVASSGGTVMGLWEQNAPGSCPATGPTTLCYVVPPARDIAIQSGKSYLMLIKTSNDAQPNDLTTLTFTFTPSLTGACCCGAHCSITTPEACAGGNSAFAGNGTACVPASSLTPCCRADYNRTGGVTVQDIFDFLAGFFANNGCADMNDSGSVSVQDIFDFLAAFFGGGC